MTGAAFPWWGWLFVALFGFVYALFEYVRRTSGATSRSAQTDPFSPAAKGADLAGEVSQEIAIVERRLTAAQNILTDVIERIIKLEELPAAIDALKEELAQTNGDLEQRRQELNAFEGRLILRHRAFDMAIEAIGDLQVLPRKIVAVEDLAGELLNLRGLDGAGDHAGRQWQLREEQWFHRVEFWADVARKYEQNVWTHIISVQPEEEAEQLAKLPHTFSDDGARVRHARFLVKWEKWQPARDRISKLVEQVAYHGKAADILREKELNNG
ncbi:hypothetical protein [Sphingomonas sp. LM7]|uniref:hypothetical protein n=1 Tax=Sphingomonas sp. LM7 TaxID=1938607 RepID=UPI001237237A|nr:hypothetical protein [Sphingomonas sp. LM7]